MNYSLSERLYLYNTYIRKLKSCAVTRHKFREKFPERPVPAASTIRRLYKKFIRTGSVNDEKPKRKRRILTEEKLVDIAKRLAHAPQKTLKRLAQETGISRSSAGIATKLLKLKPCRIPVDQDSTVCYSEWRKLSATNASLVSANS